MMKRKRFIPMALALLMMLCMPLTALAAVPTYTVTFYTDANKTTVHETQTAAQGGHPVVPATNPASYTVNGYRYEFDKWYWTIDGAAFAFSFTDGDCEIWGKTSIFAGYTQYLAEGYEMIVIHSSGTEFITDTTTPISALLKNYSGITSAYTQEKQEYESGTGTDHSHSYNYNNPAWSWKTAEGSKVAVATYNCECGEKTTEQVKPSYADSEGVRTYTATDSHGNSTSTQETLSYTVTLDGVAQGEPYQWGKVCTLTANNYRAWYVGSVDLANKVADGTKTHTFAVTENTFIVTGDTDYIEPQAAVAARLVSNASGTAVFNAKWSIPSGATVTSANIHRGYTKTDRTVDEDTLIEKGSEFETNLLVRNGDYTLNISGLTPGYYQHVMIEIKYTEGDQTRTLKSAVQRVQVNGSGN